MFHRQQIAQELDRHAIGEQRGPANLLTEQFWGAPFREQRGDRTPTALLLGLAGTGIQAWTGERQFAKEGSHADLVMSFIRERLLAVGALALLFYIVFDWLAVITCWTPASICFASSSRNPSVSGAS